MEFIVRFKQIKWTLNSIIFNSTINNSNIYSIFIQDIIIV